MGIQKIGENELGLKSVHHPDGVELEDEVYIETVRKIFESHGEEIVAAMNEEDIEYEDVDLSEPDETLEDVISEINTLQDEQCPLHFGLTMLDGTSVTLQEYMESEIFNLDSAKVIRTLLKTTPDLAREMRDIEPEPFTK